MKNVKFNQGDEIIEVIIKDGSGRKMQIWRNNISDSVSNGKLLEVLVKKWGMEFGKSNKVFLDMGNEFLKL